MNGYDPFFTFYRIKVISNQLALASAYGTISTIMKTAHDLFLSNSNPTLTQEETDFYSALFSFVYHAGGNAQGRTNYVADILLKM